MRNIRYVGRDAICKAFFRQTGIVWTTGKIDTVLDDKVAAKMLRNPSVFEDAGDAMAAVGSLGVGPDGLTLGGQALTAGQASQVRSSTGVTSALQQALRGVFDPKPIKLSSEVPTITLSAAGAGTSISGGQKISPKRMDDGSAFFDSVNDPHFRVIGVPDGELIIDSGDIARSTPLSNISGARWHGSYEFIHTGKVIEFVLRTIINPNTYRIWIDGELLSWEELSNSVTVPQRYLLVCDMGSVKERVIRFEPGSDAYFGGVYIEPTASIKRTAPSSVLRVGFMGDSTVSGSTGVSRAEAWPGVVAAMIGVDYFNLAVGGTGWLNGTKYRDRLGDIIKADLDVLYISGGQNDKGAYTTASILAEAETCLIAIAEACPNTKIILGGIHQTNDSNDTAGIPLEAGLKALATELGIKWVSQRDPDGLLDTAPAYASGVAVKLGWVRVYEGLAWVCHTEHTTGATLDKTKWRACSFITGAGKVGAPDGRGNADLYLMNESTPVHYTQAGHNAQGAFMAHRIAGHIKSMFS